MAFGLIWAAYRRCAIVLGPTGVERHGWIFTINVPWHAIASCMVSDDDTLDEPLNNIDSLLGWPWRNLVVRPARAVVRMAFYGGRTKKFYTRELRLVDRAGKTLLSIDRDDLFAERLEAMDQIIAELVERGVMPARRAV